MITLADMPWQHYIGWNVVGDNGIRTDDGIFANGDTKHDADVIAQPGVVVYLTGPLLVSLRAFQAMCEPLPQCAKR